LIKHKIYIINILSFIISVVVLGCLTGCFTTDRYHNKRHLDTIKKDIGSAHKDTDRVLGLDEPSPLVEEK
jgi:type VI protein secretion system component VasK